MEIGERIKSIRESKKMTQCALADKIHITPSYLSRIENGSSTPTLECICSIAKGLECSPRNILCILDTCEESDAVSEKIKILVDQLSPEKQNFALEFIHLLSKSSTEL